MKKTSYILLGILGLIGLNSCASNNGSRTAEYSGPRQKSIFLRPLGFGNKEIEVDQGGKNGGSTSRSSNDGYVTGDTYRREGMDQAPAIKSQVYAQVPDQILQLPEIHNQDRYTASSQEVEFKLVPLKDVPATGYHPDPTRSYTADTYVAGGGADPQPGHTQTKGGASRSFMKIRSGTGELTGMGRKLGIQSPEQRKQAIAQVRTEEGEQAHYVNGIGWIALIPQK